MEIDVLGPISRQGEFRATGITPWGGRGIYVLCLYCTAAASGWIWGAQLNSGLENPELENGPSVECVPWSLPVPAPPTPRSKRCKAQDADSTNQHNISLTAKAQGGSWAKGW